MMFCGLHGNLHERTKHIMAYSDITKSKLHFNSNYYVGNGPIQDRTDIGF